MQRLFLPNLQSHFVLAVVFSQRNDRVLCALMALGVAELAAVPPSDRATVKEARAPKHSSAGSLWTFWLCSHTVKRWRLLCGAHCCHQPERVYLIRKFLSEQNMLLGWYLYSYGCICDIKLIHVRASKYSLSYLALFRPHISVCCLVSV